MGVWRWLGRLFTRPHVPLEPPPEQGMDLAELCRRLGVSRVLLAGVRIRYRRLTIRKRGGGQRVLHQPPKDLALLQRTILRRLLRNLKVHSAATGFERGRSIVHNALPHVGKDVVIHLDVRNFFGATQAERVRLYFRQIGWNAEAAASLTRVCTFEGNLPQGAATSPRLANLVNYGLDARLARFAAAMGAAYTRYADDITISYSRDATLPRQNPKTLAAFRSPVRVGDVIYRVRRELQRVGYRLNDRKTRVYRRHSRQLVAGLVVNETVQLPRRTRRLLRAVRHHLDTGRPATLTPDQLRGWDSLRHMIRTQAAAQQGRGPT